MKKLKTILQSNFLYYFLLLIALILYVICSSFNHISCYKEFDNEKLKIVKITEKDYGVKLDLKGKEKVIGYLYISKNEINKFKNKYSLGDIVLITGEKLDITNNTVPNTFNYKKYLNSNKIYNVIKIIKIEKESSKKRVLYKVKNKLLNRTNKINKSKPYINSLLFGDNSSIDDETLEAYREDGISHLFAISGLHIAIFLYVLNLILDKARTKSLTKNTVIISFLLFYMFITNFSSSVIRASIFTILMIMNKYFDLEISPKNILFLTLFIICMNNPLAINNIGLQYSFVVTLFLILYSKHIKGSYIKRLFLVALIAFLASFPITAYNFYSINFLSIIYNLFCVPFASFILIPLVLLTYVFPFLDGSLNFLIILFEKLAHLLKGIEISKITICKIPCIIYTSYYVVLCIIISKAKIRISKLLSLVIIIIIISNINSFKNNNEIIFLDIGQGDSALIKFKKRNILIDTGGVAMYNNSKYTYKLSKNRIIPYLKSRGEKEIDTLVLTHGDFDHMGEAKYLVSNFTVKRVIFNVGELNTLEKDLIKILEEKNVKYYQNINELKVNDTKFHFLNTRIYDNENDNSNVIYFELNNKKFLFMGDAGESKEQDIIKKYNIKNIDVLKVGHHGSNTSSSKEFIDRMDPKYSVISVGKNNRYGHPNEDVLKNLGDSKMYRTDQDGSIMFKIKNSNLKIGTCSP